MIPLPFAKPLASDVGRDTRPERVQLFARAMRSRLGVAIAGDLPAQDDLRDLCDHVADVLADVGAKELTDAIAKAWDETPEDKRRAFGQDFDVPEKLLEIVAEAFVEKHRDAITKRARAESLRDLCKSLGLERDAKAEWTADDLAPDLEEWRLAARREGYAEAERDHDVATFTRAAARRDEEIAALVKVLRQQLQGLPVDVTSDENAAIKRAAERCA